MKEQLRALMVAEIVAVLVLATVVYYILHRGGDVAYDIHLPEVTHPQPVERVPEIAKRDCQRLVAGQLVFSPAATMDQGIVEYLKQ